MNAKERAKRALDTKRPHPTDKHSVMVVPSDLEGMVDPAGMPRRTRHDMVARVSEEIYGAQREAIEKCVKYIETEWMDEQGMIIAVDGKDFLDDVRNALLEKDYSGVDEEKAREILRGHITEDNDLMAAYGDSDMGWVEWVVGRKHAFLDSDFTADQLLAIAWWMKNGAGVDDGG